MRPYDKRVEFSAKVKRIIAGRAGYRCSFPRCEVGTIGPGARFDQIENVGEAAHIYPASPNGPRGGFKLNDDVLRSVSNGIWLCPTHADLIDKNKGDKYSPTLLNRYKVLHEAKVAREKRGISTNISWFEEVTFHESLVFASGSKLRFGQVTIVIGGNGVGKSVLCEWLAIIQDKLLLSFWKNHSKFYLDASILFADPEHHEMQWKIEGDKVDHFLDQRRFPFQPYPIRFVFIPEFKDGVRSRCNIDLNESHKGELSKIAHILNIDTVTLRNVFPYVEQYGSGSVKNINVIESEESIRVCADVDGTIKGLCFSVLSHSEQQRILIDIAITLAHLSAEFMPTMLIIEGLQRFDKKSFQSFADFLSDVQRPFQTLAVLPGEIFDLSELHWKGWDVAYLESVDGGTAIIQD